MELPVRLNLLFSIIVPVLNEERNILSVLESIFKQSFRPIEVIVVDGGSTDRTAEVVGELASEWNGRDFTIIFVDERDEGYGSVSHARNLGIRRSRGIYLLMIDADFVLVDNSIVNELALVLQQHDAARFTTGILNDSWLEYNLALDNEDHLFRRNIGRVAGTAFRRGALVDLRFDESLGSGEDVDFMERMAKAGGRPPTTISAMGERHRPHTLVELKRQRTWYGRTALLRVEKRHNLKRVFPVAPGAPIILFVASLLALFVYGIIGLLPLAAFFAIPITMFLRSSRKTVGRFVHLAFVRYVYASFCFSLGFAEGFVERIVRGRINPSRR